MSKVTSICGTAARCRRYAVQVEPSDRFIVAGHRPFTLADVDLHRRLVVSGGRESLALRVGMVVLASISLVNTPPSVSIPSDSGVTSRSSNVFQPRR